MKIGVVGPSHLGIVWSTVLAEKGNKVIYLKSARFEVHEPGIKELIDKNIKNGNLEYDNSYSRLKECEVVFLSWDTPTDKYNNIQLDLFNRVIAAIIPNINETAIFVVMSQVPPGFMRSIDFPKTRLFHQVDTLIFGQSIDRAFKPEVMVVGRVEGTFSLPNSYSRVLYDIHPYPQFTTFEEAEIYKLAMNAYLAAQIAVTNTMSELCNSFNADWNRVIQGLKCDTRFGGNHYFKPGLGIGGGHLRRDLETIKMLSNKHGFHSDVIGGACSNSDYMEFWALRKLKQCFEINKNSVVAILGLSYKENTDSIKDSASILTIKELGCYVYAHDPVASFNYQNLVQVNSPEEVLEYSEVLMILTPHDMYKNLDVNEIKKHIDIVIDPYGVLNVNTEIFKNYFRL